MSELVKNLVCPECGSDVCHGPDIYEQTYWYCTNENCIFESSYIKEFKLIKKEENNVPSKCCV